MKKIIDLSEFNSVKLFDKVKKDCDGIIFRAGYRGYGKAGNLMTDSAFEKNIAAAVSQGIQVGSYWVTQAVNESEARNEADYLHNLLKAYKLDLGVYLDSEYGNSGRTGRADKLSKSVRTKCVMAFLERMKELGYNKVGIYSSESWFRDQLDYEQLSKYIIWCAKYSSTKPAIKYDGWQKTDKGKIDGIDGNVDINEFNDIFDIKGEEKQGMDSKKSSVVTQMYKVKISDIKRLAYIPMSYSKGETVSTAATIAQYDGKRPSIICNAELFNMNTYKPSSGVVSNGINDLLTEAHGVAFVNNLTPVLSYKNNAKANDWIGAYPLLVRDGKVVVTKAPSGLGGSVARTAFCWNDEYVSVVYVKAEDKATIVGFAEKIVELGFTHAINLDGGGSTACITPQYAYDQGRKVRGKIGIWLKSGEENILAKKEQPKQTQTISTKPEQKIEENKPATTATQNENIVQSGNMLLDKRYVSGVKLVTYNCGAVHIRNGNGASIGLISGGQKVTWYGYHTNNYIKKGTWYYVKYNGMTGYVIADYLKMV